MKYYLVPSKGRTHIIDRYQPDYYCGLYPHKRDISQGNKRPKGAKMCKNCLRVLEARRRR